MHKKKSGLKSLFFYYWYYVAKYDANKMQFLGCMYIVADTIHFRCFVYRMHFSISNKMQYANFINFQSGNSRFT